METVMCWSGGKDSSMALHELQTSATHKVSALLTTLTKDYDRISMHGVRRSLLERQAECLGLPLRKVFISKGAANGEYEAEMETVLREQQNQGVKAVAFGDIFLEDLRAYRERNLSALGLTGVFPIWKRDTAQLAENFIASGFRAILTCVDTQVLDASFAGAEFDHELLRRLPAHVDPCGENGEFHSFVYAGPIFKKPMRITRGEVVIRNNRFCFCDLLLN